MADHRHHEGPPPADRWHTVTALIPPGQPIVYPDGVVIHRGFKIGKVVKMRTGWVWAYPGGHYSPRTYKYRDYAVDALVEAVTSKAAER